MRNKRRRIWCPNVPKKKFFFFLVMEFHTGPIYVFFQKLTNVARPIQKWNPVVRWDREINGLFGIFILIGQLTLQWRPAANQITRIQTRVTMEVVTTTARCERFTVWSEFSVHSVSNQTQGTSAFTLYSRTIHASICLEFKMLSSFMHRNSILRWSSNIDSTLISIDICG